MALTTTQRPPGRDQSRSQQIRHTQQLSQTLLTIRQCDAPPLHQPGPGSLWHQSNHYRRLTHNLQCAHQPHGHTLLGEGNKCTGFSLCGSQLKHWRKQILLASRRQGQKQTLGIDSSNTQWIIHLRNSFTFQKNFHNEHAFTGLILWDCHFKTESRMKG